MCVSRNHMLEIEICIYIYILFLYTQIRFGNHAFWETPFYSLTYFSTAEKFQKPNTLTWGRMAATFQKISR